MTSPHRVDWDSQVPVSMTTTTPAVTATSMHIPVGKSPPEIATPLKQTLQQEVSMPSHYQTPSTSTRIQQLSCLPQSACSPLLLTPGGATASVSRITPSCKFKTPGSGRGNRFTPRFHTTPGGTSKQIISNPFERHLLDKLHSDSPMFSPNMFKLVEPGSAEKTPKSFRWSIDQIAILKPAEIDEMPIQQDTLNLIDKVSDVKAQKAIEKFFEKGNIVPSPWTEPVKFELPKTPVIENAEGHRATPVAMETSCKEAACQTLITLPKDFDLQKVLGEQHVYTGIQAFTMDTADTNGDISTSSLRRKLFFHGDEGLSPVRGNKSRITEVMDMTSPLVSPVKFGGTPICQGKLSPMQTPSSGQFSSSPIHGRDSLTTPSMRRCSTAPALMDSPNFSPIAGGEGKESQFTPPSAHTRLQATPSSGAPSREFGTPGMSPIIMGGSGHGNSYMESPETGKGYAKSDSLRRRALRGCTDKPPVPRELQMSPVANPFSLGLTTTTSESPAELAEVVTNINDNSQHMDMSCESLDEEGDPPAQTKDLHRPEFTEFREYYDFDGDNTAGFPVNSHSNNTQSQDTGYQTYSVNQETGLTTTQNLSVNHENLDNVSAVEAAQTNITGHFSALSSSLGFSVDIGGGHFKAARTMVRSKFPSRVHFEIKEDKESSEDTNNKTLPFSSNYRESSSDISVKSTDDIIAEKPSRLIFSDLENLANKFNPPTDSSFTFNFGGQQKSTKTTSTTQSQEASTTAATKSICKSFSTGNMADMQRASAFDRSGVTSNYAFELRGIQAPPEPYVSEHNRMYTKGSMINHEQVSEPLIYVTTQGNQQQSQCSQCISSTARSSSCDCVRGETLRKSIKECENFFDNLPPESPRSTVSQFSGEHVQCSNKTVVPLDTYSGHNNTHVGLHHSISAASALLPPSQQQQTEHHQQVQRQSSLQLGCPAHSNPAFTIETLTPKNTGEQQHHQLPRFSGLFPLGKESHGLGVAPLVQPNKGVNNFGQRLLFPDQHPASPVASTAAENGMGKKPGTATIVKEATMDSENTTDKISTTATITTSSSSCCQPPGDTSSHPWYTMASCTPKRQSLQKLIRGMERRKQDVTTMLPSEVAIQVLRKAERDLDKLKNGEELDPSFLDNTSFQDSCIVEDIACGGGGTFDNQ